MQKLRLLIFAGLILSFEDYSVFADNFDGKNYYQAVKRPCPKLDLGCIRRVLGDQLICGKPVQEPYHFDNLVLYLPSSNSSFVWKNAAATGFRDYSIKDFYINEKTNTIVFEVGFKAITANSPKSDAYFYAPGREPVITSDYVTATYKDLSFTLTVPYDSHYKVPFDGRVFTYISDTNPVFHIGVGLIPKEPEAARSRDAVYSDLPVTLKEVFVTQGPAFMSMFFQIVVCDYGFKNML